MLKWLRSPLTDWSTGFNLVIRPGFASLDSSLIADLVILLIELKYGEAHISCAIAGKYKTLLWNSLFKLWWNTATMRITARVLHNSQPKVYGKNFTHAWRDKCDRARKVYTHDLAFSGGCKKNTAMDSRETSHELLWELDGLGKPTFVMLLSPIAHLKKEGKKNLHTRVCDSRLICDDSK